MNTYRILAAVILLLLGGSAIYGGWMLIADPSGASLGIPVDLLEGSPFPNYFIPGLLLFLVIGLDSLVLMIFTIKKYGIAPPLISIQGIVLCGYLSVEILMGFFFPLLQAPYYLIGLLLIGLGWKLSK